MNKNLHNETQVSPYLVTLNSRVLRESPMKSVLKRTLNMDLYVSWSE